MALLWLYSASFYDDSNIEKWIENTNDYDDIESTTKMEQQYLHQSGQTTSGTSTWEFSSGEYNTNEIIFGMSAQYNYELPATYGIEFRRGSSAQFTFRPRQDGSIAAYRGDYSNTYLYQSDPGVFRVNEYNYFEFKLYVANSGGYFYIRVNGKDVWSWTGLDTQYQSSAGVSRIAMRGDGNGWYWANAYVCDNTGSYWNDFQGPIWVRSLPPTTSGELQQWDPSGETTNLDCVHQTGHTPPLINYNKYIYTTTDGEIDTYKFTLPENVIDEEILGTAVTYFGDHNKGTTTPEESPSTAGIYRTETTFQVSGENSTSPWIAKDATQVWQARYERNPSGEIEWTREHINSGEFGVKVNYGHY